MNDFTSNGALGLCEEMLKLKGVGLLGVPSEGLLMWVKTKSTRKLYCRISNA